VFPQELLEERVPRLIVHYVENLKWASYNISSLVTSHNHLGTVHSVKHTYCLAADHIRCLTRGGVCRAARCGCRSACSLGWSRIDGSTSKWCTALYGWITWRTSPVMIQVFQHGWTEPIQGFGIVAITVFYTKEWK
jgi:hypothetical protein